MLLQYGIGGERRNAAIFSTSSNKSLDMNIYAVQASASTS